MNRAIGSGAIYSHNTDEWETPQALFDSLDAEFHFNLDPCATEETAKCRRFFTKEDDGLSQNWGGAESSAIHHTHTLRDGQRSAAKKTPWS